ncbi:MAG: NCS2 family permease [Planctomycetota bacterium]|nr:NCS2 family permease [Planctomycetota bacterium]
MPAATHYPLFARRDLDGFFGLFIDNIVQLLLILALCGAHCGMAPDSELMLLRILPGAALSILLGNVFYAWQARRLAQRTGRNDVTALPYGINTPSLIVFVFFVMLPTYSKAIQAGDSPDTAARLAWQMGLIACLGSGLIELLGSFVAERIRRHTPRAALLSTLAGIAIGFISMTFALQIYHRPLIAMLPFAVILLSLFARHRFPGGLPGGLIAVVLGTLCAWSLPHVLPASLAGPPMQASAISEATATWGVYLPVLCIDEIWELLSRPNEWGVYLSVIVPMGLFNVIGSLQNIESASASGDEFDTGSSLAVNGVGTIVAALFGSCFPTTIYIGHPGWKELGSRAGYSTLNGLVIAAICLTGTVTLINAVVPLEAGISIVLWIGVIITAQAFRSTPPEHAPAVALGFFPAIAAWGATVVVGAITTVWFANHMSGATIESLLSGNADIEVNGFLLNGLIVLERGYIFTCLVLAAIAACLVDRKLMQAASWSAVAAILAFTGLTHAYQVSGNTVDYLFAAQEPVSEVFQRGTGIGIGYLLFTIIFVAAAKTTKTEPSREA